MSVNYKKLAAVAGAVVGAVAMKKLMDNYEVKPPKQRTDFDKLVETQLVCDYLDGATLAAWIKKQQESFREELIFFVVKFFCNSFDKLVCFRCCDFIRTIVNHCFVFVIFFV